MGTGELAAIGAAFLWAIGSLLYSRIHLNAFEISLGKNVLAIGVFAVHLLIESIILQGTVFQADWQSWGWLALSGLIGIVIGDTLYFRSLQILGPRKALIVSTSSPLFTALMGWIFLSEQISAKGLAGILMTVTGVTIVVADRGSGDDSAGFYPGTLGQGVWLGILAAFCTAAGAVASRTGMRTSGPLEAAFVRVFVSGVTAVLVMGVSGKLGETGRRVASWNVLKRLLPAIICGTWLGIWLSQVAYKYTSAATANTLTCTTPLFVTPMVRFIYGHRITVTGVAGALLTIMGIAMITVP